ncbi:hypothetical protein NM939_12725, partial [Pasteurella multocida]|nr:hypothetical protein [Pasteurella multocida subsp. multocida]MDA5616833.1 hypothetical protein [Pasteurella multocida]MDA5626857.1 hypothetical protein [Pasteurella multocida]
DGQEQPKKEVEDDLPEWLANASDEVKENFRNLEADKNRHFRNVTCLSKLFSRSTNGNCFINNFIHK